MEGLLFMMSICTMQKIKLKQIFFTYKAVVRNNHQGDIKRAETRVAPGSSVLQR